MLREVAPNTLACGESDSITLKPATHGPRLFRTAPFPMTSKFRGSIRQPVSRVIIGRVVMQSIFHQDLRYFYKGTGSIRSRALYAIGTAFVVKGDNGNWQFDYSDVLGGMASHELSTLYYPSTSRPVRRPKIICSMSLFCATSPHTCPRSQRGS